MKSSLSDEERRLRKSERRHKYYIEHKESQLDYSKKYREENRDKFNKYSKNWRERNYDKWIGSQKEYQKKYIENNKEVANAHTKTHNAIARGVIAKQACEICGAEEAEAHHNDYNKPLEVRWLCKRHHAEWHRNNKPIKKGDILCQK